jgi:DNA-binding NarL/FixJ family response regulator
VLANLAGLGFDVDTARCPQQAVSLLEEEDFDIVLMEFSAPHGPNASAAREIMRLKPMVTVITLDCTVTAALAKRDCPDPLPISSSP